jgi:thiamine-phosphate diphosphorylase
MSLTRPVLCVITRVRGSAGSAERELLLARLADAAAAGATLIQVRERLLSDRDLVGFTRELVSRIGATGARVLVNDRLDLALAAGAHGVHLKSDGPGAADVRSLVPSGFIVGRSIHSEAEARVHTLDGGLDYLLFGTVFRSESKPEGHVPAGLDALSRACAATPVPVVAIGGIDVDRARDIARAGAAGIAAISLFANAVDVAAVVSRLRDALTVAEGTI